LQKKSGPKTRTIRQAAVFVLLVVLPLKSTQSDKSANFAEIVNLGSIVKAQLADHLGAEGSEWGKPQESFVFRANESNDSTLGANSTFRPTKLGSNFVIFITKGDFVTLLQTAGPLGTNADEKL
jgi:hypothetical protein